MLECCGQLVSGWCHYANLSTTFTPGSDKLILPTSITIVLHIDYANLSIALTPLVASGIMVYGHHNRLYIAECNMTQFDFDGDHCLNGGYWYIFDHYTPGQS